ncbi:MAG TPA: YebC/PmpR family DNA-binding transcriptional regulator [Candidatus Parcubacteria bacterium]|jgi:YebC/PmpR family DNA-binding regulatory protein|nr:YebC/PmpR family DNA-binding transcriptional regulator [Candidatus Parcubacteria bacterium]|tara:strand:+ start:617 stop:1351 length:735 start_codon:yes stop_codon:yes gene_type:complete
MSGHSHAKKIFGKKQITDAKRGKIFSKFSRQISVAAKEKGGDLETNSGLRMVIERAKSFNMPKENIEKAIKKGTGELEDVKLENVIFEAYGPGKTAIIIEGITDNKNRALGEIKKALSQFDGKLAGEGSVRWMFERKGVIIVNPKSEAQNPKSKEELELMAIEAGAQDINWHEDVLDVYTKPEELEKVKNDLKNKGLAIESTSLDWVAKDQVEISDKEKGSLEKLFESLDENEAVQEIYSNLKE